MNRWLALFLFLLGSFIASAIGGWVTFDSVRTWYPTLVKAAWNPPAAVFAPVWTLLYILMSVAAWRVWLRRDAPKARLALRFYFVSLAFNTLWSVLFFGLHRPNWSLLDNLLLLVVLGILQVWFSRIDRVAGWLWTPYLAWVTYAITLNAAICWLN
jgi:tryptophan-rich sensory protein